MLLAGDAGVGKTRLLAELRDRAQAAGYRVLVGHCLDFGDSALPYLPFSEAFGRLATEAPTLARSLVEAGPAIARLMPARRVLPEQSAPADDEQPGPRSTGRTCSRPCTPPSSCSAGPSRCCSSSRTCTGPTGPPARC